MIIEVSSHGSVVKRDHDSFVIINKDSKQEFPAEKVDAIIITANALISTQAVRLCIEKNIQLVISEWSGKPVARLWSSTAGKNTEIRRKQYLNQDTDLGLGISREVVETKLKRQREFLIDLRNNRKKEVPEISAAISTISETLTRVKGLDGHTELKQQLLGLEGSSAAVYFRALSASLSEKWSFEHRSQYPARDGFNSVLNYTYGIAYSAVEKVIILSGLDPNAGFYHADAYGKPTLSYDIMELVRPMIDRTVVSLFTKRIATESWFEKDDATPGIFLTKDARLKILSSYHENNGKEVETIAWEFCRNVINRLADKQL